MSTEEELTAKITVLGNQIKETKAAKKPKEEWDPLLQEMLAAKVRVSQVLVGKRRWNDGSSLFLLNDRPPSKK